MLRSTRSPRVSIVVALLMLATRLHAQGSALTLITPASAGHTGRVNTVSYSRDGKRLVSASDDQTVHVWDAATGRMTFSAWNPEGPVLGAWFVGDSSILALDRSRRGLVVRLSAMPGGSVRDSLPVRGLLSATVRQSPSGGVSVATLDSLGTVRVWDVGAMYRQVDSLTNPLGTRATDLAWTPDGSALFVSGKDSAAMLQLPSASRGFALAGTASAAAWTAGQLSAAPAIAGTVRVSRGTADAARLANARSLAQRGDSVAFATVDGVVHVWTPAGVDSLLSTESVALSVAWSPAGQTLAVGTARGRIELWNLKQLRRPPVVLGEATWVSRLALSPSASLAASATTDGIIHVWEPATGRIRAALTGHSGLIQSVAFSPSVEASRDTFLLSASTDSTVRLWNLRNLASNTFGQRASLMTDAQFSPDGKTIAAVGSDSVLRLWTVANQREQDVLFANPPGGLRHVRFLSADTMLVVEAAGRVWKLHTPSTQTSRAEGLGSVVDGGRRAVAGVALSRNRRRYAVLGLNGVVDVWDRVTQRHFVDTFPASPTVLGHSIDFLDAAGDSLVVATGSTAYVGGVANGKTPAISLVGHTADVYSVVASPNGRAIFTASKDGFERVWRARDFSLRLSHAVLDANEWVAVAPDGRFDGSDGAIRRSHFVVGLDTIPLEGFFLRYITPGLSQQVMADSSMYTPDSRSEYRRPPVLTARYDAPADSLDVARVTVEGQRGNTDDWAVHLFHNGARIGISDNTGAAVACNGSSAPLCVRFAVQPIPGINVFEAVAVSKHADSTQSDRARVVDVEPTTRRQARLFILAVGVSTYPALSKSALPLAAGDARRLAATLDSGGRSIFREVHVDLIPDSLATRQTILAHFAKASASPRDCAAARTQPEQPCPEDVFVFLYGGHGTIGSDKNFYILPANASSFTDPVQLRRTAISRQELDSLFNRVRALKRVMIIDACHSGKVGDGSATSAPRRVETQAVAGPLIPFVGSDRAMAEERAIAQLARSAGIYTIASADGQQVASERSELRHSVFTYTLLRALGDSSAGAVRERTIAAVMSEVEKQIPEVSARLGAPPQHPQIRMSGQDFPLIVR